MAQPSQADTHLDVHAVRQGHDDLLQKFNLDKFYKHMLKAPSKNYLIVSSKEAPHGVAGDARLFKGERWSLASALSSSIATAGGAPARTTTTPGALRAACACLPPAAAAALPEAARGEDVHEAVFLRAVPPDKRQVPVPRALMGAAGASGLLVGSKRSSSAAVPQDDTASMGGAASYVTTFSRDTKRTRY